MDLGLNTQELIEAMRLVFDLGMDEPPASKSDELPIVVIERVPYITKQEHAGYPAGTKCFAERKYPEFNVTLEFDGGLTVELPEWYYLDGLERPGCSIMNIEDRKCMGQLIHIGKQ